MKHVARVVGGATLTGAALALLVAGPASAADPTAAGTPGITAGPDATLAPTDAPTGAPTGAPTMVPAGNAQLDQRNPGGSGATAWQLEALAIGGFALLSAGGLVVVRRRSAGS